MPIDLPLAADAATADLVLAGQDAGALTRRSVLPGGVRVLSEQDPQVRSVSLGLWVPVGSRDESEGRYGATHFLEHLLFKGTPTRTPLAIASAFDEVGGESNAFTAKESTCYFGRVRSSDLPMALEILLDMVTSSVLDREAFETERRVILEELAMAADDPVDVGQERLSSMVLGDTPLGRPIGGSPESITVVGRDAVLEHYRATYRPETLVVTAAGDVDHDELCEQVSRGLETAGWMPGAEVAPAPRRDRTAEPVGRGGAERIVRDTEQSHVFLGLPGITVHDDRRWVLSVLNSVLGGGMSSRLFQSIREERGLAYSVYSFASSYTGAGLFGIYAGCRPEAEHEVATLLEAELDRLAADGITAEEHRRALGQLSGGLVLGFEDTAARMSRLGRAEIVQGRYTSIDENLARIAAVTRDEVAALAAELAAGQRSHLVVGPALGT